MGYCEYTWCKYDDETDSYYQLNEDELALKRLYVEKYFGRVEDKMLFARQMVLNGEITKE